MSTLITILPLPLLRGPHRLTGPATKLSQAASSSPESPPGSPRHGPPPPAHPESSPRPALARAAAGQAAIPAPVTSVQLPPVPGAPHAAHLPCPALASPSRLAKGLTAALASGAAVPIAGSGRREVLSGAWKRQGVCPVTSGAARHPSPCPWTCQCCRRTEPGVRRAMFSVLLVCLLAPLDLGGL